MKNQRRYSSLTRCCMVILSGAWSLALFGQAVPNWEAFNDYRPSDQTHPNVTGYDLRILDDGGPMINFATGNDLNVDVYVVSDSAPDDFGANSPVNVGSPADLLFGGKVVIGNDGLPGLRNSNDVSLVISFEGLDPSKRYSFRGTVSRGGGYADRWSMFTILGAEAFVDAHVDGSDNLNLLTKSSFPTSNLESNQAALNSGDNKAGSLIGWDNIEPGPDGIFEIEARQYVGAAPFGNPAGAPYGYGFTAIYLAEFNSTGNLRITENPTDQTVPAGSAATLRVGASSPQAVSYQWQSAPAGSSNFTDVAGATSSTFSTGALGVADNGKQYRCRINSAGNTATSSVVSVFVDGTIPTVASVRGSINFNAVHVTFSEPMRLDGLSNVANYQISGGLTIQSAVAQNSTSARLLTSEQTPGARYTVNVSKITDLAGNPVPSGIAKAFSAFSEQKGVVGLEVWNNTAAGNTNPNDLQTDARYPDSPNEEFVTSTFDSEEAIPNGPKNTYGARFRAWLTPEETADYEFFIQSDGGSEFHIGLDDQFGPLEDLERIPEAMATAGSTFQEPGIDDSVSFPIRLTAGKRYAVMVIWKEDNGQDYCQVAWRKTTDITFAEELQPIPSRFLSYYGPGPEPMAPGEITRIALEEGQLVIEWTGSLLQSTEDFSEWTEVTGAASPYQVTPDGAKKFFRANQ